MTGLTLYRSNHLEVLGACLAENVAAKPPADPLAPLSVAVGSRSMERWLRHTLADRAGICALLSCPFPAAAVDRLIAAVCSEDGQPAQPQEDPWGGETLCQAVLAALRDLAGEPELAPLAAWADLAGIVDGRLLGLARQIAAIFDGYITYRPALAVAWSRGRAAPGPALDDLGWQPLLWRAIQRRLDAVAGGAPLGDAAREAKGRGAKDTAEPGAQHRAQRLAAAIRRLRSGRRGALEAALGGQPLRIFGVSTLPPVWLELLGAVSGHAAVELYLLCPSAAWWEAVGRQAIARPWRDPRQPGGSWCGVDRDAAGEALDMDAGIHPLLGSLGRLARDFQIALQSQIEVSAPTEHGFFVDRVQALPPEKLPRALHRLQADILHARAPGVAERHLLAPGDDSIQMHTCHGLTRQVEVLREALLGLFADRPELEPRDVVVLCPDIETAAPVISAVFDRGARRRLQRDGQPRRDAGMWGPQGAPQIPFTIADLSVRRLNRVADVLLRVLELAAGRVEASAVLDLMGCEPVRARFGIEEGAVSTLQGWIQEAGIRWGIDGPEREPELGLSDGQNTWRFGLRRLLAGVVMAGDGRLISGGGDAVLPFDAMEGRQVELLGRLVDLCNTLFALISDLKAPRPLAGWVSICRRVVEEMSATSKAARWLTRRVGEELDALDGAAAVDPGRPMRLDALRSLLAGRFEVASPTSRDLSGGVTFCAMAPMRGLPHRVVCLLGMDDGALPRRGGGVTFDLCARHPRVGDRDPRDEDRYLLLEAILSARDHLILTWSGRDVRSNEALAPCVPVVELCQVLDRTFVAPDGAPASERLRTEHPLQAFSPRNFERRHRDPASPGALRAWSFDRRMRDAAEALRAGRAESGEGGRPVPRAAGEPPQGIVTLEELEGWLLRPARTFLQRRLKVDIEERDAFVTDREPIELDGLQRWALRDGLLRARLQGLSPGDLQRRLRAEGVLPLGTAGEQVAASQGAVVEAALAKLGIARDGELEPFDPAVDIDLLVGGVHLRGVLDRTWRGMWVHFAFGKEKGKHLLRPWLRLLAWQAADPSRPRRALVALADEDKGAPKPNLLGLVGPTDALEVLSGLVALYRRAHASPLPLFEGASWVFAKTLSRQSTKQTGEPLVEASLAAGLPRDPKLVRCVAVALDKALDAFGPEGSGRTDMQDAAVAWLYRDRCPLLDLDRGPPPLDLDFARVALRVWAPILEARRTAAVAGEWPGLAAEARP